MGVSDYRHRDQLLCQSCKGGRAKVFSAPPAGGGLCSGRAYQMLVATSVSSTHISKQWTCETAVRFHTWALNSGPARREHMTTAAEVPAAPRIQRQPARAASYFSLFCFFSPSR